LPPPAFIQDAANACHSDGRVYVTMILRVKDLAPVTGRKGQVKVVE